MPCRQGWLERAGVRASSPRRRKTERALRAHRQVRFAESQAVGGRHEEMARFVLGGEKSQHAGDLRRPRTVPTTPVRAQRRGGDRTGTRHRRISAETARRCRASRHPVRCRPGVTRLVRAMRGAAPRTRRSRPARLHCAGRTVRRAGRTSRPRSRYLGRRTNWPARAGFAPRPASQRWVPSRPPRSEVPPLPSAINHDCCKRAGTAACSLLATCPTSATWAVTCLYTLVDRKYWLGVGVARPSQRHRASPPGRLFRRPCRGRSDGLSVPHYLA
ncbi:hypothetical protein DAMDJJ_23880 [Cupriavidus necator]